MGAVIGGWTYGRLVAEDKRVAIREWLWKHRGYYVGCDGLGNRYYRARARSDMPLYPLKNGRERRWVSYRQTRRHVEASAVPVDWHGWLHHMHDVLPSENEGKPHFMKEHKPNKTGTDDAWLPQGSVLYTGERPHAMGDYRPWSPSP